MLFSLEEGNAKVSVIRRRAQTPRRDVDLNTFSQALWGSATDDLIAETSYFAFNCVVYGEPVHVLEKRFGLTCSMRFKDEFGCYCWSGLMTADSLPVGNCSSLIWTGCTR